MSKLPPHAQAEYRRLMAEARSILEKKIVTRGDGKKADLIMAQMAAIRAQYGVADTDDLDRLDRAEIEKQRVHTRAFRAYLRGNDIENNPEFRGADFLAGSQELSFSDAAAGGVLVPMAFQQEVAEGLAQVDPLLDGSVCDVVQENDFRLPPLQLPGWDISTIAATKVTENAQHNSDNVPGVTQKLLNRWTYRLSLGASFEWDEDQGAFERAETALARCFGIGFARGIGADLINGDGTTAPEGVLTAAADSGVTTASATAITADEIADIYFSLNQIYRNSPKCAWVISDAVYKLVRKAKDLQDRPLLDMTFDGERLMGKRVLVSPSMPSTAGSKGIVLGDLSHYTIHASTMWLRRRTQAVGYAEYGKSLYTGLMAVDAVLNDPTGGTTPPVIFATLHA